jgi:hypothetical protein
MTSVQQLNSLSNSELQTEYEGTISLFKENMSTLKKDVVYRMRDILILLGTPKHKVCATITRDLDGEVSERYIRELLGKDYTDPLWSRDQSSNQQKSTTRWSEIQTISDMDKTQLREYGEFLENTCKSVKAEMHLRKMATNTQTSQDLDNKSNRTPLADEQVTKPKYSQTETQKEWIAMIQYECKTFGEMMIEVADEFIPQLNIQSEEQARRYANAFKSLGYIFAPAVDEKYRLSIMDWVKLIKLIKIQGASAASKLYKKPLAAVRDIDPTSLPENYEKTLLAMTIDKNTDQVQFISPTKEHLDSRLDVMLGSITKLINGIEGLGEFVEMLDNIFKLRNVRAAMLSEKLSDSK